MFSEKIIASFAARARRGRLITEDAARKELGLTRQRFARIFRPSNPARPKRHKVGRVFCVNGDELALCLTYLNNIDVAMGLSELARYLRITYYTALQQYENGELPKPFGMRRGRPRWLRCDVDVWRREQLGGAKPPDGFDPPPPRGGPSRRGSKAAHANP